MNPILRTSSYRSHISVRPQEFSRRPSPRVRPPQFMRASAPVKKETSWNRPAIRYFAEAALCIGLTALALGSHAPFFLIAIESLGTSLAFIFAESILASARKGKSVLHLQKQFFFIAGFVAVARLATLYILSTVLEKSQGRNMTPEEVELSRAIQQLSLMGAFASVYAVFRGLGAKPLVPPKGPQEPKD